MFVHFVKIHIQLSDQQLTFFCTGNKDQEKTGLEQKNQSMLESFRCVTNSRKNSALSTNHSYNNNSNNSQINFNKKIALKKLLLK